MNVPVRRIKVPSSSGIGCGCCKCLHLGFLHSSHGMFKIIEMILGGLCQTMLMNFGPAQAQLIGMSFYSLLSANAAATSGVTLLLICYVLSENTYNLIRTSIFEIIFNLSAAFSYLSASTFLSIAVNLYLYPVYLVTMGFISYPAMIAAYTIGFALGITHAVDAYHAYRHYKGFPTN
ncbi:protein singles bar [Halyomorpha halys]|uniref:protein singles bar n=1 Tax=Halyomorpha halys TaxID=286706 RepID=UPI0006D50783|nr:protein singles bar [Halyomorpha halys]